MKHAFRVVLAGLVLSAAACGSSTSSDDANGGSGGSGASGGNGNGGSSAGGSGGNAGSPAGGSGGSAGAVTGGSAGSPVGGSAGVAGSASGGTSGDAGGDASPNDECEPLCNALVAANCANGPTQSGCLVTCKALTSSASCDPTANAYLACVGNTTIQCNAAGEPVAQGCGLEWLAAIGCAVNASPNQALVAPCDTYCNKVVAAGCPNNGNLQTCNTNCLWAGVTGTGCDDEWGSFLSCANGVNLICLLGYATAPGCGQTLTAYSQCMNAAGSP